MNATTNFPEAEALSNEFNKVLNQWLKPEVIAEINRLNATPAYSNGACATHDFCDPNQAILDAWSTLTNGQDFPLYNEDEGNEEESNKAFDIVNSAWAMSRKNMFKVIG